MDGLQTPTGLGVNYQGLGGVLNRFLPYTSSPKYIFMDLLVIMPAFL